MARDEGRVIFFCGAGVSRARAGLPDFFGLAQKVIDHLGVSSDSPARRLVQTARETDSSAGLNGLISADRIFGLLEREFLVDDVQFAVAKAIEPCADVDLSAHHILLDLARWPDGKIRLITTNFDRLFQACDSGLRFWRPPSLPSLLDYETFEGIIHLHGCVNENYTGADGNGFILSSPEFGKAYLSDGWATKFIQGILSKYFVVFVGYTADDPPVQYLLEALNRSVESRQGLYAFQSGTSSEAQAKWLHKGVQPIAYDEGDNHKALWTTLEKWAVRARDPDIWYKNVISLAQQDPEALLPHERGQVAHVVSTLEGVKKFSASTNPPPAEWLCVFDMSIRYATPGFSWNPNGQGPYFDPFAAYGLDSDPIPLKIDPDDFYAKRELPGKVWDCFAATRMDRQNLNDENFPALRGQWATHVPRLPHRLARLGIWIAKVSNQPAAVWWLAGHTSLHPDIQFDLRRQFDRNQTTYSSHMRLAWRYLFEILEAPNDHVDYRLFELKSVAKFDGWSNALIRQLARLLQPRLIARRPWSRPKPPSHVAEFTMRDILELEVEYPKVPFDLQIPDEHLQAAVREFRKNLERAVSLETELGGAGLTLLVPIESDPDLQGTTFARGYKIAGAFLFYVGLFKKLIEKDASAAKQECLAWPSDDDATFTALRIWVSGDSRVFPAEEAANILCQLNDHAFWYSRHQRDLLLVLVKRWSEFSETVKTKLGDRLLEGPARWNDEEIQEYAERRAWSSLNRIHWLHFNGCEFYFDIEAETNRLRQLAPAWQSQYAQKAADSMESRGGIVRTDTEYESLVRVPLGQLLDKAQEISGRAPEILTERKPFAGLASARPIRALTALTIYGRRKEYPKWAWKTFLNPEARKSDKPKLSALIADRISRLPPRILAENIYSVCDWLLTSNSMLFRSFPAQFDRLWVAIISVLKAEGEVAKSSIGRGTKEADWPFKALNAPVGTLARVLLSDSRRENDQKNTGLIGFLCVMPLGLRNIYCLHYPAIQMTRMHSGAVFFGPVGFHIVICFID